MKSDHSRAAAETVLVLTRRQMLLGLVGAVAVIPALRYTASPAAAQDDTSPDSSTPPSDGAVEVHGRTSFDTFPHTYATDDGVWGYVNNGDTFTIWKKATASWGLEAGAMPEEFSNLDLKVKARLVEGDDSGKPASEKTIASVGARNEKLGQEVRGSVVFSTGQAFLERIYIKPDGKQGRIALGRGFADIGKADVYEMRMISSGDKLGFVAKGQREVVVWVLGNTNVVPNLDRIADAPKVPSTGQATLSILSAPDVQATVEFIELSVDVTVGTNGPLPPLMQG